MTIRKNATPVPTHEFAQLLIELHALIAKGQGDSEEADSLREKMEPLWFALDQKDQERLTRLSADLYTLAEDEVQPVVMTSDERHGWGQAVQNALDEGDWDRLLILLQKAPA